MLRVAWFMWFDFKEHCGLLNLRFHVCFIHQAGIKHKIRSNQRLLKDPLNGVVTLWWIAHNYTQVIVVNVPLKEPTDWIVSCSASHETLYCLCNQSCFDEDRQPKHGKLESTLYCSTSDNWFRDGELTYNNYPDTVYWRNSFILRIARICPDFTSFDDSWALTCLLLRSWMLNTFSHFCKFH